MKNFIKINSILFSSAIFLLNPILGMEQNTNSQESHRYIGSSSSSSSRSQTNSLILSAPNFSSSSEKPMAKSQEYKWVKDVYDYTEEDSLDLSWGETFEDDYEEPLRIINNAGEEITMDYIKYPKEDLETIPLTTLQKLHLLAGHGRIKKLKELLIDNKGLINTPLGEKQQTLLMAAIEAKTKIAKCYKSTMVMFLIKQSADITAADAEGNTCLHLAVKMGDIDIMFDLLCEIIKINKQIITQKKLINNQYDFALSFIKRKNNAGLSSIELAEKLLSEGSEIKKERQQRKWIVDRLKNLKKQLKKDEPKPWINSLGEYSQLDI